MKEYPTSRKSHCSVCGNRLSKKSAAGKIIWQPSHVDDKGIYCETCYAAKTEKGRKKPRK